MTTAIAATIPCPACGKELSRQAFHCPACGHPLRRPPSARKSRAMHIVLGLFLGGLGIHSFYAGHMNKGLFQLLFLLLVMSWLGWLTCGLGYVGWGVYLLIDTILTDRDGEGQQMT